MTKNQQKLINSLKLKKYRNKENLFICEGVKIFETLVKSDFIIKEIFAVSDFIDQNFHVKKYNYTEVLETELKKISELTTPQKVLTLVEIPKKNIENTYFKDKLTLVLDNIQDPGNLGTIVRIADWFGIKNIVCSLNTVDLYSPKVVQATMGSIFSVNIFYTDLIELLKKHSESDIYGTFMNGHNIYKQNLSSTGFIVMGNEANGISSELEQFITTKLSIPTFNQTKTAESLNVAVATAIICSEFIRR
ncbi:MAG: RNA methyltransferase [Bacteroidales bacterium]|nr:RNA methyltransferase [Bacteroidales bacterium]